jgi:hypothetical protein
MHLSIFCAAMQSWDYLSRIQQLQRVEGSLYSEKLRTLSRRELNAHGVEFLNAHTVLAGDRPAQAHAGLQDIGAKQLTAVHLIRIFGVK